MSEPTPMTDEELSAIRELIDTTPGTGPVLRWADEARLLTELERLRTENETLSTEAGDQLREAAARTVHAQSERDQARAELAAMMNRPGELAMQLAEIGGMVGYPDPSRIVAAVRAEVDRLTAERDGALARIEAAREEHEKSIHWPSGNREPGPQDEICLNCHDSWPCLTVRALDGPAPVDAAERPSGSDADTGEGTAVPEPHARPEGAVDER